MHPLSLKIVPPFQVLILGALMWLVHQYVPLLHWHSGKEYLVSRILLLLCLAVFIAAVYQFWRNQTTINPQKIGDTRTLITTGIYRFSRNPIYVADVLLLLAWAVWLGDWANLIFPGLFICYMNRFQIEPEEQSLRKKFGNEFDAYCARVRRWI